MTGLLAYALRVNGQDEPLGVVAAPGFSWRLESQRRGARQRSYRIRVHHLPSTGRPVTVWDSGDVDSALTVGARYDGAPLVSSSAYEWELEVVDDTGARTRAGARFGTGIVHADDWRAAWIARNPVYQQVASPPQDTDISYTVNKLQPVRRFVRRFDLTDAPASARVHASAKGIYRLYVNGHRVGHDELVPGWTEYRQRITYQTWDVTDLLRPGPNTVAALLGDGWYVGFIGTDRRHQAQHYGTEPAVLVQLVMDGSDGSRRFVVSDDGWRESASDILYADLLMGQYEDSRRAEPGWQLPGHDTSGWSEAVTVSRDTSLLVPEADPAVRVTERVAAVRVTARGAGRHVVDFGQNLVGRVALTLRDQAAGTRVQLAHAEVLDERGELYTANLRTAEQVDVFWTDGSPRQVFEPRFTLHGFRFVEISGVAGDLSTDDVEAVVLHNDFDRTSAFETSSADLNALASNISWSLRGNFVSIPTDCPQRDERLGWLADAQVFTPTALLFADVAALLTRWMRDVRGAQSDGGAFPDIAPHLIHLREGAPAWGDGGVTIPWHVHRATGDTTVLRDAADSMIRWVRHVERHNPDLIWRNRVGNNYGDWLQLGEETPKDVLATAYFARSAELTARSLAVLGRPEAPELADLAERIRRAYRAEFIAPDGRVHGDTQGSYLLTLAFELCAPEDRDRVAERLVAAVERRGVSLTTGFVTVGLLCPVLTSIGRSDLAYKLVTNDRYPSWLFSVRNGATTIWERWDGWTPERGFQSPRMNSFNHYSLGAVGEWLFTGILGITQTPDSAGYRHIRLAPQVDASLDWARGAIETPRGRVESSWRRVGVEVEWTLRIPPGDTAEAAIPASSATIREGSETATRSQGISLLAQQRGLTLLRLESGSYHFRFPAEVPAVPPIH
ncbi:alpha-L-rhamnosidase [Micromonospora pallida]|uniref:alpha-L-rhamnosidase n=1 Tax=Micromonospora pallida TaxID=145854 RepID=A0A1C6SFM8_9ACTN|nr:alpha-L-rhamnosidase [Micromonospora pallida]SCL28290.1 alpha-L-rhamnosidase [Micromonospora pallida]